MPKKTSKKRTTKTRAVQDTVVTTPVVTESPYSFQQFINFVNNNFSLIFLVGMMFIGGFVAGSLWTENQITSGGKKVAGVEQVAPEAPSGPDAESLKKTPQVGENEHKRGAKNPVVTIIEYSDYECPFCNRFHDTMTEVMDKYGDKVQWVYRHYPLTNIHPNAQQVSEVSECVAKYGSEDAFWKFTDAFYGRIAEDKTLSQEESLLALAQEIGVNKNKVKTCLDNGEMTDLVVEQRAGGQGAGISGTPGSVVISKDGQYELIPGALPADQVGTILDKYIK